MAPLLYKEMIEQYYNGHVEEKGKKYRKRNLEPPKPFIPVKKLEDEDGRPSKDRHRSNPTFHTKRLSVAKDKFLPKANQQQGHSAKKPTRADVSQEKATAKGSRLKYGVSFAYPHCPILNSQI